jgi:hypothetical protein
MSRAEGAFTADSAVVSEVMLKHAPGFVAHGFELTGADLAGSAELQRFPVFHFLNKQTGMRIDVSYYATLTGLNGGFTVLIIKPPNSKLEVEDYLKLHGHEELSKSFTYHGPVSDLRSFADSFLRNLVDLLDGDLKPILEGTVWEETPIDWMGYK